MWRDERLYYRFTIRGYPKAIADARDQFGLSAEQFSVVFLDEDGFKLFEHAIPLSKMKRIIEADGRSSGLEMNDDTWMDPDQYRRVARWDIGWNYGVRLLYVDDVIN